MLTAGLAGLMAQTAPARIINVTSGGQYAQHLPEGDPESRRTRYTPKTFYARTKRAELVITEQWAERLTKTGVHVHAMHPGWADTQGVRQWMPVFRFLSRPIIRTSEQGADTVVWLGASPDAVASTGLFWQDRRPRPTTYALGAHSDSPAARAELWNHVTAITGEAGRDPSAT